MLLVAQLKGHPAYESFAATIHRSLLSWTSITRSNETWNISVKQASETKIKCMFCSNGDCRRHPRKTWCRYVKNKKDDMQSFELVWEDALLRSKLENESRENRLTQVYLENDYLCCCLASGEGIVLLGVRLSHCVCVHCINLGGVGNALYIQCCLVKQGGHKPGKPGILRDFSDHRRLRIFREFCEFCATSGKNCNKVFLVRHSNICLK